MFYAIIDIFFIIHATKISQWHIRAMLGSMLHSAQASLKGSFLLHTTASLGIMRSYSWFRHCCIHPCLLVSYLNSTISSLAIILTNHLKIMPSRVMYLASLIQLPLTHPFSSLDWLPFGFLTNFNYLSLSWRPFTTLPLLLSFSLPPQIPPSAHTSPCEHISKVWTCFRFI